MNATQILKKVAGYAWRLPLCAAAYFGGVMAGGALVSALGMLQSCWLAPTPLILHNLEICIDSMVYALVLVLLLVHGGEARAEELCVRFPLCREQATVEK